MEAPVQLQKWDRGDFDNMDAKSSIGQNSYFDDSDSPQGSKVHDFLNTSYAESPVPFEENSVQLVFDPTVFESSDQLMITPRRLRKRRNDCGWSRRCFCATSLIILSLLGFLVIITAIIYLEVSLQVTEGDGLVSLLPINETRGNITWLEMEESNSILVTSSDIPALINDSQWEMDTTLQNSKSEVQSSSLEDLVSAVRSKINFISLHPSTLFQQTLQKD